MSSLSDRLRILHVITDLELGGAEMMLVRLVEHWQAEGHRNAVLSLTGSGHLAPRLAASGAVMAELGLARGQIAPRAALRLSRLLRSFRPDLVQGWMYHGNLAASLARMLVPRRVPVLWGVHHSLSGPIWPKTLTRILIRGGPAWAWTAARIVYCSKASAAQHERIGYGRRRSAVIPNGVDTDRFRPDPAASAALKAMIGVPPETRLVGLFARLDPMKDHAGLLQATALLRARGLPLHLVLAGSGVDTGDAALGAMIAGHGLAGCVTLLGERDDVDRLMPGLDVFALASAYGEAFPVVLIEAMAAGVPCVATRVGDSAEILGEIGIVVPPRTPAALADAIQHLLTLTPDQKRQRVEAGRRRVLERWALRATAERYLELYRSVLAPRAADPSREGITACAD